MAQGRTCRLSGSRPHPPSSRKGARTYGAFARGGAGADTLLLIGHTDTVHTRGWKERWAGSERESPFSGAVVDGAVWGRGASDLKAGLCMTLEAVRTLDRAGIEVDPTLLFAFVGDEESGEPGSGVSAGARAFSALIASRRCAATGHGDLCRADDARRLCRAHGFLSLRHSSRRQVRLFWRAGTWRRCAERRPRRSRSPLAIFRGA